MFDFNFNWDWSGLTTESLSQPAPVLDNNWLAQLNAELAALASVATVAAVNSPAVVQAPTGTAPDSSAVQQVVNQVVQAAAPVLAPSVPAPVIDTLVQNIPDAVVSNPQVVSSPTGQTVPDTVINNIASSISTAFNKDAQADAKLTQVVQQAAPQSTTTVDEQTQQAAMAAQTPASETLASQRYEAAAQSAGMTPTASTAPIATTAATDAASVKTDTEATKQVTPAQTSTPTATAAQESGTIGATSISSQNAPFTPVTVDASAVRKGEEESMIPPEKTTVTAPSALAAGESGTIGAVSIANTQAAIDSAISSLTSAVNVGSGESGTITGIQMGGGTSQGSLGGGTTGGGVTGGVTTGGVTTSAISTETNDAFALVEETFRLYGLEELVPFIKDMMVQGVGPSRAALLLKTDPKYNVGPNNEPIGYKKRFYGNELRRKAGLNVLTEDEYLTLESSYSETLKAYGQQNYFGSDAKKRQASIAEIIGNDISADEFRTRVQLVTERVENTDPTVRDTLKTFYNIDKNDLVGYFLNPKEALPILQQKVTTAEIGSAALEHGVILLEGLKASLNRMEELAKMGVTKEKAAQGYSDIAAILPETTKLSEIYASSLEGYRQTEGEQEVFEGLASAQRKRMRLAQREVGTFKGSAGLGKSALSEQTTGIL